MSLFCVKCEPVRLSSYDLDCQLSRDHFENMAVETMTHLHISKLTKNCGEILQQ